MQTVETSQYIDTEKTHAPSNACKRPQQNLTVECATAFGKHPTAIRLQRTLRLFVQFFHFLRKYYFIATCSMQTFRTVPLGNYLYTAPLPHLANTLPQYGCNALYACLYSFSISCASIISSLHVQCKPFVQFLSGITFTLRRYRIWQTPYRNTVATLFTPVCTVFPFPAQVLFHPPQVRGRILLLIAFLQHLQLF